MYKLEKNKITYFNNDIMVVENKPFPYDIDCVVDDDGYKLLSAIPNIKSVEISGGAVLVNGKTKIAILDTIPPQFDELLENSLSVKASHLKNAVKFVSTTNYRPILNGVFVGGNGTIIATDSFKMYAYDCGVSNGIVLTKEFIKYIDTDCVLKYNERFVCAELNDKIIYGRLLSGEFPRIFKLLEPSGNVYSFDCEKLKNALKIGLFTKSSTVEISDGIIKFEGELNTYAEETDLNVEIKLDINALKTALDIYEFNSLYYQANNKPILFMNDKEKILLIGRK